METFETKCTQCGSTDISLAVKINNSKFAEIALYCNDCENEEYITQREEDMLFDTIPLVEQTDNIFELGDI
jgi:hypothetical protein